MRSEPMLRQIFERVFSIDESEVESLSMETHEFWDSLKSIELLLEIEQVFGFSIDLENFIQCTSYGLIREFIESSLE